MTDTMRWRYGDTNPIVIPVDSSTVIEIGDLVYLDSDDAKSAGQDTNSDGTGDLWNTDLATTQEAFHDIFAGVAMQRSRDGDTDSIRVATSGVFEMLAASDTYELGQLVGADKATGNNLLSQQVEDVATVNLAVGRVARREPSTGASVLVNILNTVIHGGPQAPA